MKLHPRSFSISLKEKIIAGAVSLVLVIINIIRVFRVPITHDEVYMNQRDLTMTYGDYVRFTKVTANTHPLNSIIRKFFIETFGNTPFFLRLDNLLAQIVFLACSYGIAAKIFKDKWWRISCFLLLNLNPFLFEFWGLSRGYGLAIALMTASIYCFLCYTEHNKLRWLVGSLLLGIGAVYSNFSLLSYLLSLAGFIACYALFFRQKSDTLFLKRELPVLAGAGALTYLLIAAPIRRLVAAGELYYGGENGLVADTIASLVQESMYLDGEELQNVIFVAWLITGMIVLMLVYWGFTFLEKKKGRTVCQRPLFLLSAVGTISFPGAAASAFRYQISDQPYGAVPVPIVCIGRSSHALSIPQAPGRADGTLPFYGLSAYNFCNNITLSRSRTWWYDQDNLAVLERIMKEKGHSDKKVSLRVNWEFMPAMNYYIYTRYPDDIDTLLYTHADPDSADTTYDYMYLKGNDDILNVSPRYELDTVFETGFQLLKKKKE